MLVFFSLNNSDRSKIIRHRYETDKMKSFKNISVNTYKNDQKSFRLRLKSGLALSRPWIVCGPFMVPGTIRVENLDQFLVTSITDENESFGITGENSIRRTNSS